MQAGLYEFVELCRETDGLLNEYFSDDQVDLEEALSTAEDTMYHEAFGEELPRIFSSGALGASDQIPFGYLIEGTQEREVSQAVDLLVSALRSSGRTCSSHVIRINCDAVSSGPWNPNSVPYAKLLGSPLAEALRGNTVVVSYGRFDEGGTYSPRQLNFFRTLMAKLAKVCDTTQVIFVTPEGKPDVMRRVEKTLPLPVIELRKDRIPSLQQGRSEVLEHLKHRAEIDGAEPDAALERLVDERAEDKSALDPEKVFREWRVRSSVEKNCPVYQEEVERYYEDACSEESSALEKLDELIGLDQVKRVVTVSGNVDNDIFESAIGSVLFIDEAYNLKDLPHTVANLIAFMENHREDTMVILAGYKDSIERLIDSNPGFRSRLGGIIEFPGYTVEETCDIFQLMCRRAKIELPQETVSAVHDLVARGGRRADQGTGRYVRNIFERALRAQRVRLAEAFPEGEKNPFEDLKTLLPCDLLTHEEEERLEKPQASAREQLNDLIGLADVKRVISEHLDLARLEKIRRRRGMDTRPLSMHMAFLGNPGTGKTEVARLVARILHKEGVLSVGDLYECGKQDLVSPCPGISAQMIRRLFQEARGLVIFIDEAYTLVEHAKGSSTETIDALIDQMEELLAQNPGFASRVPTHVTFPDYAEDELIEILEFMAEKRGLALEDGARHAPARSFAPRPAMRTSATRALSATSWTRRSSRSPTGWQPRSAT